MVSDSSEAEWQNRQIVSLRHEAEVLQEKMEGLRQQIRVAETDMRASKSSVGALSRVSTAAGSSRLSLSLSVNEDQQVEKNRQYRTQIVALEDRHRQLTAERTATTLATADRDLLAAKLQRTAVACVAAEQHAAHVEEQVRKWRADAATTHPSEPVTFTEWSCGADIGASGHSQACSSDLYICRRRLAHTRDAVEETASQVAGAISNLDVATTTREVLLREHSFLLERLDDACQSHASASMHACKIDRALWETASLAAEFDRCQVQLRSATSEADALYAKRGKVMLVATNADVAMKEVRKRFASFQASNADSAWLRKIAQPHNSVDINTIAFKMECRNAEASVSEFRTLLSAALEELPRLQALCAQRLRQLQMDAEAATSDRRAFSVTGARLHALGVEMVPHVAMLTRLLQDERAQGVALKRVIAAAMDVSRSGKSRASSARHGLPKSASPSTARRYRRGQENAGPFQNKRSET